MGLDMYLSAATYLDDFETTPPEEKAAYARVLTEVGVVRFKPLHGIRYVTVKLLVATWKDAYQVHDWLIAHTPDGGDIRLAEREIAREDLEKLVALCNQLLRKNDNDEANHLLPWPSHGLETKDDWDFYWWNLQVTVKQLGAVLKDPRFVNWEFFYQAS